MHARSSRPDYFSPRLQPTALRSTESLLEAAHPAVAQAIALLWGHAEMNAYFDRIWAGEAGTSFAPDELSDLMLLTQIHRRLHPAPIPQVVLPSQRHGGRSDPWDSGFSR